MAESDRIASVVVTDLASALQYAQKLKTRVIIYVLIHTSFYVTRIY